MTDLTVKKLEERIKELEEAEKVFIAKEQKNKVITDSLPLAIFEINDKGIITFANKFASKVLGYEEPGLTGQISFDLIIPEDRERAMKDLSEVMKGDTSPGNEYTLIRKDGSRFTALFQTKRVFQNNKVIGVRGFLFDITKSQKAENELRRIYSAVEDSTEAILITDMTGKPLYLNQEFGFLFGYTLSMLSEFDINSILKKENEVKTILNSIKEEAEWKGETVADTINGRINFELRCSEIMNDEYIPVELLWIFSDITERKRAENERLQKEKLEGVLEMAGAACHEFNQPLQVILGYSQLIMDYGKIEDSTSKKLQIIKKEALELGEITKKLQNITKYETTDYLEGKIIDIHKASK